MRPLIPADAARPPPGEAWLHEPKLDGYRFQVMKDGERVRLFSKSGAEYADRLARMLDAFAALPTRSAVLDGELCTKMALISVTYR
jgi:bifunctional non-homologous end joining protein LigD